MPDHPYLPWPVFRRSVVAAFRRSLTIPKASPQSVSNIKAGQVFIDAQQENPESSVRSAIKDFRQVAHFAQRIFALQPGAMSRGSTDIGRQWLPTDSTLRAPP